MHTLVIERAKGAHEFIEPDPTPWDLCPSFSIRTSTTFNKTLLYAHADCTSRFVEDPQAQLACYRGKQEKASEGIRRNR
ncbi:fad binding domain-containing protein [Moniliophthora roreri]|nr:fad binding domain-containing protein [Moniliophthora roreri]